MFGEATHFISGYVFCNCLQKAVNNFIPLMARLVKWDKGFVDMIFFDKSEGTDRLLE